MIFLFLFSSEKRKSQNRAYLLWYWLRQVRELVKNNLPILIALFSLYFATLLKILAIAKAMPAFFASSKGKTASQNLGSLFITNSLTPKF